MYSIFNRQYIGGSVSSCPRGENCTFIHGHVERRVWDFQAKCKIGREQLIAMYKFPATAKTHG